ncbi:hypothetical protein BW731_11705 [Vagococcus martis]|uniref:histidine kinase n=1 Tax=Vagococcus martis TaxID=1768210 RepID=A0A1V4DKB9_9ENTE|nr:HAMP domain-containing sensor histidine kinase [Vagococcus martis]OPF88786.1 hypothetical protein BW731_11705 [Vagococcus martis]
MKLFTKNFLYTTTIIFLVTTLLLAILYVSMPKYYLYTQEKKAAKTVDDVITQIDGKSTDEIVEFLTKQFLKDNNLNFTVSDKNNLIIFPDFINFQEDIILSVDSSDLLYYSNIINKTIVTNKGQKLDVVAQYSLQQITDARDVLIRLYPFLLLMALILGSLAAFLYSKHSTKRILKLMDKTTDMRELRHDIMCDVSGNDEISQLADNINKLYNTHLETISMLKQEIKKVEQAEQSKSNFMRMASHELKTPLAGMTGIVDGMIYNVGKFKDRDTYLLVCQKLLKEQADLIQNILSVTSLDTLDSVHHTKETICLAELIENQLETYRLLGDLGEYIITINLDKQDYIEGNRLMVDQVISNVLSNAFRYTPYGKTVAITLANHQLIVENDCLPIDIQSIEQLFEPFYRFDDSRDKKTGGTGLGLYIVKQVAEKNHWRITINVTDKNTFKIVIDFK